MVERLAVHHIDALAAQVAEGRVEVDRDLAEALLAIVPETPEAAALMAGARRIRAARLGARLRACSIINAKAGGCSENCRFCAQSAASTNHAYPHHEWCPDDEITRAAASAAGNGAQALSLVAAWKELKSGRRLDQACAGLRALTAQGAVRADASLGIIRDPAVAVRLAEAGCKVYCHNIETAPSFFPAICDSHGYDDRLRTIDLVRAAGIQVCSGGIIGLGETPAQRAEFALELRRLRPDMVPINFLMPLPGTPFADRPTVPAGEALVVLAAFRFLLPDRNLLLAGGKEVTFGDRLAETLDAGINAVMVGNYLTTLGTDPAFWRRAARERGLEFV